MKEMNLLTLLEDSTVVVNVANSASEAVTQAAQTATSTAARSGFLGGADSKQILVMVGYIVLLLAALYFMAIKPQKKRAQALQDIQDSIAVGSEVMTSSGFYGTVVDIQENKVVVEFGASGSKSVRIPVKKSEIYGVSGKTLEG
jgi:preprotein translocase subunit YajC